MKIKSLKLKNFANIKEFTTNLGSGVNFITASNGQGKSTVGITSILALMEGIGKRGETIKGMRVTWIGGAGDRAEIEAILYDDHDEYTVSREIKEDTCPLKISAKSGKKLDQKWLDSIFSGMMLSPIAFSRLPAKAQAEYMGIDTAEFDKKIEELKDDASFLRRSVKDFGEVEIPEKVEAVDVSELSWKKDVVARYNRWQESRKRNIEMARQRAIACEADVIRITQELQIAQVALENRKRELKYLVDPKPVIPTTEIDQKISAASETNSKAIAYQNALKKQEEKEAKQAELDINLQEQKDEVARKVQYMQDLDLPFSNLSIDASGGLLMDGRPIKEPEFSHAEVIKICTMLISSKSPEWKYVFLADWSTVDSKKSAEIFDWLLERGFQILAEKVVDEQDNVLILTDVNN